MELKTEYGFKLNYNTLYQKISSKTIVKVGKDHYLFSIKKNLNNMLKNKKLELLGGCMDIGEDDNTIETLRRELSEEEETGLLAGRVEENIHSVDSLIIAGKSGYQLYKIYSISISMDEYESIKAHYQDLESYGFVLLDREHVESREWFFRNSSMFTPKTCILFSSLLMSGTNFVGELENHS